MKDRKGEDREGTCRLAFKDLEFLESDAMRPLRLALEFSKIDLALKERGITSTVVVFGSHRIVSPDQAEEGLKRARSAAAFALANRKNVYPFGIRRRAILGGSSPSVAARWRPMVCARM